MRGGPEGGPENQSCLLGSASLWHRAWLTRAGSVLGMWGTRMGSLRTPFSGPGRLPGLLSCGQDRAGPLCPPSPWAPRARRGDVTGRACWGSALPRETVFQEMSSWEGLCEGLQTGPDLCVCVCVCLCVCLCLCVCARVPWG